MERWANKRPYISIRLFKSADLNEIRKNYGEKLFVSKPNSKKNNKYKIQFEKGENTSKEKGILKKGNNLKQALINKNQLTKTLKLASIEEVEKEMNSPESRTKTQNFFGPDNPNFVYNKNKNKNSLNKNISKENKENKDNKDNKDNKENKENKQELRS